MAKHSLPKIRASIGSSEAPHPRSQEAKASSGLELGAALDHGLDVMERRHTAEVDKQYDFASRDIDDFMTDIDIEYKGDPSKYDSEATDFIEARLSALPDNARTRKVKIDWNSIKNRGVRAQTKVMDTRNDREALANINARIREISKSLQSSASEMGHSDPSISGKAYKDYQDFMLEMEEVFTRVDTSGELIVSKAEADKIRDSMYDTGFSTVFWELVNSMPVDVDNIGESIEAFEKFGREADAGTASIEFFSRKGLVRGDILISEAFFIGNRQHLGDLARDRASKLRALDFSSKQNRRARNDALQERRKLEIARDYDNTMEIDVIELNDGDSGYLFLKDGREIAFRMSGYDADELNTFWGGIAFQVFRNMLEGQMLSVRIRGSETLPADAEEGREARFIVDIIIHNEDGTTTNAGVMMVERGAARYDKSWGRRVAFEEASRYATANSIGVAALRGSVDRVSQFRDGERDDISTSLDISWDEDGVSFPRSEPALIIAASRTEPPTPKTPDPVEEDYDNFAEYAAHVEELRVWKGDAYIEAHIRRNTPSEGHRMISNLVQTMRNEGYPLKEIDRVTDVADKGLADKNARFEFNSELEIGNLYPILAKDVANTREAFRENPNSQTAAELGAAMLEINNKAAEHYPQYVSLFSSHQRQAIETAINAGSSLHLVGAVEAAFVETGANLSSGIRRELFQGLNKITGIPYFSALYAASPENAVANLKAVATDNKKMIEDFAVKKLNGKGASFDSLYTAAAVTVLGGTGITTAIYRGRGDGASQDIAINEQAIARLALYLGASRGSSSTGDINRDVQDALDRTFLAEHVVVGDSLVFPRDEWEAMGASSSAIGAQEWYLKNADSLGSIIANAAFLKDRFSILKGSAGGAHSTQVARGLAIDHGVAKIIPNKITGVSEVILVDRSTHIPFHVDVYDNGEFVDTVPISMSIKATYLYFREANEASFIDAVSATVSALADAVVSGRGLLIPREALKHIEQITSPALGYLSSHFGPTGEGGKGRGDPFTEVNTPEQNRRILERLVLHNPRLGERSKEYVSPSTSKYFEIMQQMSEHRHRTSNPIGIP